jgi:two-component system chemotaxis response regulator CheB
MAKTRVLVVEDSLTVRRRLVEVLNANESLEVIGECDNGLKAVDLVQHLRPDVVTLDMMLPGQSGLAATEQIMAFCPTPILIVSSSTNRGELFQMYQALAAGALDVLEKPAGNEPAGEWEAKLITAVRIVSRIKVITHPRARLGALGRAQSGLERFGITGDEPPPGALRAVAIGVSTGGPAALVQLLSGLPADFPLPILIVLHIGALFASSLAEWLDGLSPLRVAFANDNEILPPPGRGVVRLAPPDRHLILRDGRLRLTSDPERHSCRPSVDTLFESVARELGPAAAACVLTGMGSDGAEGLLAIRRSGGRTIAQDEASSVVFGMPKEAALLGGAEQILPLSGVAPALLTLLRAQNGRRP